MKDMPGGPPRAWQVGGKDLGFYCERNGAPLDSLAEETQLDLHIN